MAPNTIPATVLMDSLNKYSSDNDDGALSYTDCIAVIDAIFLRE